MEELAVGMIGADYGRYLIYLRIGDLLAAYAPGPSEGTGPAAEPLEPLVRLKKTQKAFKPPEVPDPSDDATEKR